MPSCRTSRRGLIRRLLRNFIDRSVWRKTTDLEYAFLEHCIREELTRARQGARRLEPIKVMSTTIRLIDRFSPSRTSQRPTGVRELPFTRELTSTRRLRQGRARENSSASNPRGSPAHGRVHCQMRARSQNGDGSIADIHVRDDLETKNNTPADGRKVKGTIK